MLGNLIASMMMQRGTGGGRFGVTQAPAMSPPQQQPQAAPGGQWGSMLAMMQAQQQQQQAASGGMGIAELLQRLMRNRQPQNGGGYQMQPGVMPQMPQPQQPMMNTGGFNPQLNRFGAL